MPGIVYHDQTFITYQPENTQHRHTHQITDRNERWPGQGKKNDEEVKRERGVKVRRVQGGEGREGRREGKESRKQAESEEEEGGGETEQQRQDPSKSDSFKTPGRQHRNYKMINRMGDGSATDLVAS